MHINVTSKAVLAAATLLSLMAPLAAKAVIARQSSDYVVGSTTLRLMPGSVYDSVAVVDGALKVTVPAGEAIEVRAVESVTTIENDAGLATCNVLKERVNQMVVNGPITTSLRPVPTACSTNNASTNDTPTFAFSVPAAGEKVKAGTTKQLFWSVAGRPVSTIRIRLSVDGGETYPSTIINGGVNNGFHNWNIPSDIYTTTQARLKIEGYDQGRIVAISVSEAFTIDGVPAPSTPSNNGNIIVEPYDYDPAVETSEAETIGIDKRLRPNTAPVGTITCNPDSRIKVKGSDAVYYCGKDGKRYVFPNKKTHDTWYDSFIGVMELTSAEMARIPLGGNVTYRPGTRLVKVTSAPDVFAVAADGTLRYVTEAVATRLYGPDWNTKIDDIPDAFFTDYVIGEPVK